MQSCHKAVKKIDHYICEQIMEAKLYPYNFTFERIETPEVLESETSGLSDCAAAPGRTSNCTSRDEDCSPYRTRYSLQETQRGQPTVVSVSAFSHSRTA